MKRAEIFHRCAAFLAGTVFLFTPYPALAQGSGAGAAAGPVLPRCKRPRGTVALAASEVPQFAQAMGLGSPVPLIRLMILQSGCFRLVDRGRAFQQMQIERSLAARGELQAGANMGAGQIVAADYILTPTIVSQNENAGGIGGLFSSLLPGVSGTIASNINLETKRADTLLTLTNTRTGVQESAARGSAEKTDLSLQGGVAGLGGIDLSAAGRGYQSTDIGRITAAAFLDAYAKLIPRVPVARATPSTRAPAARSEAMPAAPPSRAAPRRQARPAPRAAAPVRPVPGPYANGRYEVTTALNVRGGPSSRAEVLTTLSRGSVVTATGKHKGNWWIVMLPDDRFGWVYATHLWPR